MEADIVVFGPRRCSRHGEQISSDDGMFDGVCGGCESEMDQAAFEWEHDPKNPYRSNCGYDPWGQALGTQRVWLPTTPMFKVATCQDKGPDGEDDIIF